MTLSSSILSSPRLSAARQSAFELKLPRRLNPRGPFLPLAISLAQFLFFARQHPRSPTTPSQVSPSEMPYLFDQAQSASEQLSPTNPSSSSSQPGFDSEIIFPILCVASLAVFALQSLFLLFLNSRACKSPPRPALEPSKHGLVLRNGGRPTLGWGMARLVGLLSLVGVHIWVISEEGGGGNVDWPELTGLIYLASMSLLSVIFPPSSTSALSRSLRPTLVLLLFLLLFVHVSRIAPPLIFFNTPGTDTWTHPQLVKLAILSVTAVLPPLLIPTAYVPVSPEDVPTREETSSLLSFLFFTHLDALVLRAWRKPTSLDLDDLPELRSREEAAYLRTSYLHILDPSSTTSSPTLFRGMLKIFWKEALLSQLFCLANAIFLFGDVLGTNHLLLYFQSPNEAVVRPWVWAALIGGGPFLGNTCFNLFMTVSLRFARQVESLLLSLLFEHSLRLRVNETPTEAEGSKKEGNTVGKINSLVSSDIASIASIRFAIYYYTECLVNFIVSGFLLWRLLGWTSLVAMGLAFLALPLTNKVVDYQTELQRTFKSLTDVRIQKVSEAISGLRITKALGLQAKVKKEIETTRTNELEVNRQSKCISLLGRLVTSILPNLVTLATLAFFTTFQGGTLDAATIFTSINLLQRFSTSVASVFSLQEFIIGPSTALERIDSFLRETPLVDCYLPGEVVPVEESWIGFRKASFSWENDLPEDSTRHNFRLEVDDLTFEKGKITVVTGPTGSGKTSLLMALLGEMHFEKNAGSICSLPRSEGVSYVHQQSFVQNLTIRANIVFGSPFDRERYKKVVSACGLEADFAPFAFGDLTEVGEKGITLSGGQRSRISLARAIYSSASTVLIDDCFSSLDVQTSKWIVDKCFKSSLVKGRTVILVTHHLSLVASITDFLVAIENGRVVASGPVEKVLAAAPDLITLDEKELIQEEVLKPLDVVDKPLLAEGKLAVDEDKIEGKVSFSIMKSLVASFGGPGFWISFFLLHISFNLGSIVRSWWFSVWSRSYSEGDKTDLNVAFYLGVLSSIMLLTILINASSSFLWASGTFRSGRLIHQRLLDSVITCTLRFLDVTPQGRLLSRFTKDIRAVDTSLSRGTEEVLSEPIGILVQLGTIIALVPLFSITSIVVAFFGSIVAQLYLNAQRSVKREQSNRQTPVFVHFSEVTSGLTSIRAFGAQQLFRAEGTIRVNNFVRATASQGSLNRWSSARFDLLEAAFSSGLAAYLLWDDSRDASRVGLILSVSLGFATMIIYAIRSYNDWEVDLVSFERIQSYVEIEHEPTATPSGTPPASWPTSGSLKVEGLTARYSKGGPKVLEDVSFSLKSGQKCAVVGRTGSGKSTLALSLLRLIPTEGGVVVDGLDTSKLNLQAIRSNITLIPQDPTLFSGDIRKNIDPVATTDDAALNDILRSIGLLRNDEPGGEGESTSASKPTLSLDSHVSAGGVNLSQGTRQLVSFARGLVRRSKIFLFDECTASIDYETDALIQQTLRTELHDSTLVTIAHRLLSIIDYDVILVLSDGKVVEFDSPRTLLGNPKGHFRALVDASSDRDTLLSVVESLKE